MFARDQAVIIARKLSLICVATLLRQTAASTQVTAVSGIFVVSLVLHLAVRPIPDKTIARTETVSLSVLLAIFFLAELLTDPSAGSGAVAGISAIVLGLFVATVAWFLLNAVRQALYSRLVGGVMLRRVMSRAEFREETEELLRSWFRRCGAGRYSRDTAGRGCLGALARHLVGDDSVAPDEPFTLASDFTDTVATADVVARATRKLSAGRLVRRLAGRVSTSSGELHCSICCC